MTDHLEDEGHEYPGFEFPPEYAQSITKIISYWAALEYNVNMSIWHLAGVYPAVGACLTEQIFTLDGRLKALLSLLKLRRAPADLITRVNAFSERAHRPKEIRNRVAHDPWLQVTETKQMQQLAIGARGTLTYGFKDVELKTLLADQHTVWKAMREAVGIRDAIELSLPTLPEIYLGELHPTVLLSGGNEQTRSIGNTFRLYPPKPSPE